MKIPKRIQPLVENGLVDEVIGRLMSGKEADVFVVRSGSDIRCAKVYKEASKRSFKQAVLYQEGRKVRNSRRARAMEKGSKFGRKQQEETWQTAEVDALFRLAAAGVRVPQPYDCLDGVLLMELITDAEGEVAPRLGDVTMSAEQAIADHAIVMQYIVQMLFVGLIHGDLSEFNVLVDEKGPVIIDLPQAIDAAGNNNAESMLTRDVNNMRRYYGQFAPELLDTRYAKEIWGLYEDGILLADSKLTGLFEEELQDVDLEEVIDVIEAAHLEELERQERLREAEQPE
jgi:RIO kinase 1